MGRNTLRERSIEGAILWANGMYAIGFLLMFNAQKMSVRLWEMKAKETD